MSLFARHPSLAGVVYGLGTRETVPKGVWAMALRYCGDAVITIVYYGDARGRDAYRGTIAVPDGSVWRFDGLYPPAVGFGSGAGYGSPAAYDAMARSAVSFGSYYTSHNRPHDDASDCDWIPSADVADAIDAATSWARDDSGDPIVFRSRAAATV